MKLHLLFFTIFVPILLSAQINESFTDGNFTTNPEWTGITQNFKVNTTGQLQSNASSTSVSYLFTPSQSFVNAVWECWVKINYTTSSSNYAAIYISSDADSISNGCNGYYVQVGGTNDEVSLFIQQGTKKTKIIDGIDKRTDGNPIEIKIKVTRDANGNFQLFSKLSNENDYVLEGKTQNQLITECNYFGLLFSNTSTTGNAYLFDDIKVTGQIAEDKTAPVWENLSILAPNSMQISFSEKMNFDKALFIVDNGIEKPQKINVLQSQKSAILEFNPEFQKGLMYTLEISGLTDKAGNELFQTIKSTGIPETAMTGDLVWNEVMFDNAPNSVEYLEIYNTSNKVINMSGKEFMTRKTDGSLNSGCRFPASTLIAPHSYLAICSNPDSLINYHGLTNEANIIEISWATLNNQAATIVLCNEGQDTIYDELTYNVKWHNILIKNPKGVALEKINPALPTQDAASWHSAASVFKYGTPGYINSQFREISVSEEKPEKMIWAEPESFSPDNDGMDDVCFIHYKLGTTGNIGKILILNAVGVKVMELASTILLQSEGFVSWDGKTDRGIVANPGIYVVYFEIFNPETGYKKTQKLPIVVSLR